MKVAVLMGGVGSERAISLASGKAVVAALAQGPFEVLSHDIHPDDLSILDDSSIDVFFPALHGSFGEDGQLQKIFEAQDLCYVGSGAAACALMFDKLKTKEIVIEAGIRTPPYVAFTGELSKAHEAEIQTWGTWVVKPVCEGSSVGVSILEDAGQVLPVAQQTFEQFGPCLIEQFIAGREVTVGILLGQALPVIEIKPDQAFYDYQAKYEDNQTQYLFDTLSPVVVQELQSLAQTGAACLGLRHFGRLDFLVDDCDTPWFLEANAIPGLTDHSLLPKAAQREGLSMAGLCECLVTSALQEKRETIAEEG